MIVWQPELRIVNFGLRVINCHCKNDGDEEVLILFKVSLL